MNTVQITSVTTTSSVTSIGNPHTQVHTHTRTIGKEAGRFQPRRRELPLGLRQCDVTQDVFGERAANGYEDVYGVDVLAASVAVFRLTRLHM
jgi:hypothetical protein